jgi:hypothetical protein
MAALPLTVRYDASSFCPGMYMRPEMADAGTYHHGGLKPF